MSADDPREDAPDVSWVQMVRVCDDDTVHADHLADGRASARMLGWVLLILAALILAGLAGALGLILWAAATDGTFWAFLATLAAIGAAVELVWFLRDVHPGRRGRR